MSEERLIINMMGNMGLTQGQTVRLTNQQKKAAYNHKRGWTTTAQPFGGNVDDYREAAKSAAPDILEQAKNFCTENNMSFMNIPHEDFMKYESRSKNFREWLDDYCKEKQEAENKQAREEGRPIKKYHSRADILIIGPRIKSEGSSKHKAAIEKYPNQIKDYLGIQLVALKKRPTLKNRKSLENLKKAMEAIDTDERTLAIKNLYYIPHEKTKFRAFYSLWQANLPQDHEFHELDAGSILCEIKLEHESQMDIDKLTRKFVNIGRAADKVQLDFPNKVLRQEEQYRPKDARSASKLCVREENKKQDFDSLGEQLYNRVFKDAGLDKFLAEENSQVNVSSANILRVLAQATIDEHFSGQGQKELSEMVLGMSVFEPPKTKTKSKQCKNNGRANNHN